MLAWGWQESGLSWPELACRAPAVSCGKGVVRHSPPLPAADPWWPQAGAHPNGAHACHRWLYWGLCRRPRLGGGAALPRQRARRALCPWPRLRLGAALPRQRSGGAPCWRPHAAPVCAAAHDLPGMLRRQEMCLPIFVAFISSLAQWQSQPPPRPLARHPAQSTGLCPADGGAVPGQPAAWCLHQLRRPAGVPRQAIVCYAL